MVLIQSHPALADDGPLALLRQRRAEAEAELPRSVALTSLLFLTAFVLVMVGSLAFRGGPQTTVVWRPIPFPTPNNPLPYVPTGGGEYRVAPPAVVTGKVLPVKDADETTDPPIVSPTERILDPGPPGELDGPRNGPVGNPGPVAPEVEPLPTDVSPADEFPQVVSRVTPEYPAIARQAGAEGSVVVRLLIGLDGRVRRAEIERSSALFDESALAATKQWTFTPAKANGHPVLVWIRIPVKFTLH